MLPEASPQMQNMAIKFKLYEAAVTSMHHFGLQMYLEGLPSFDFYTYAINYTFFQNSDNTTGYNSGSYTFCHGSYRPMRFSFSGGSSFLLFYILGILLSREIHNQ